MCWTRWVAVLAVLLAACVPARRKVQTDVVKAIGFRGNGGFFDFSQGDYALMGAMEQKDSSFGVTVFPMMYWVHPVAYDPVALDHDGWRLEVWYAHHGWLDARFLGWEVIRMRPRRSDMAGVVRIVAHVDPGPPSLVRAYSIDGLDKPLYRQFRNTILRTGDVHEGTRFDLDAVDETKASLLTLLGDHGFPYARAQAKLDAYPGDHAVDVTLKADPGILSHFGEIRVHGNDAVRGGVIRDSLTFQSGALYDVRELTGSQKRVYQLGTFSVVNVTPDLSHPTVDKVPVDVSVTEAQFQTLRLGGGLSYRGATLTPRASLTYRDTLLFHRLLQLQAKGSFGYGFQPRNAQAGLQTGTPVYSGEVDLSTPHLGSSSYGLYVSGSITQDVQSGQYTYFNPKGRIGVTWRPTPEVIANFGPQFELYQFKGLDREGLLVARQLFGASFQNPYTLTKLAGQVTIDWRDDPVSATRGTYFAAGVEQALPIDRWVGKNHDGGFLYTQLNGDVRLYTRIKLRRHANEVPLTGALRIQGKGLIPWASNQYLPYPEKAFLGGANTLRGFLVDQVGPYDSICTHDPSASGDGFSGIPGQGLAAVIRHLPRGGVLGASVMGELRYGLTDYLRIVAFTDVGLLLERSATFDANSLRFGSGIGARYDTAVGPIRVDLAARPLYPEDQGPTDTPGCLPGDNVQLRSYDALGAFFPKQRDPTGRVLPFAFNVYLAIGEAF